MVGFVISSEEYVHADKYISLELLCKYQGQRGRRAL